MSATVASVGSDGEGDDPGDASTDTEQVGGRARIDAALTPIRRGRYAEPALLVAVLVGVAVSAVHWGGLILGGALVGLVSHSLRRAVVNAFSFGLFVLVVFAGWLAWQGTLLTWPTTGQLFLLTVASALGLPILAAGAVRGLL